MPRLIFTCIVLVTLFCLLCAPALVVARRLERRGDVAALRALPRVWMTQVVLASALIFAADTLGWRNPAGYMVGIVLGTGVAGAALFGLWRIARRWLRR
jgi:O-antigen/teichoic acid export membrane protein